MKDSSGKNKISKKLVLIISVAVVALAATAILIFMPRGNVRLKSDPTEALVYNEKNEKIGRTPLWIDLELGKHRFTLKKKDYRDKEFMLDISDAEETYRHSIKLVKNNIYITSDQKGVEIFDEENKSVGSAPISLWSKKRVRYFTAKKKGYYDERIRVEIRNETDEVKLPVVVYPLIKIIRIKSDPSDASVKDLRTGKEVGKTPLELKIEKGNYLFELSKKDFISSKIKLSIKKRDSIKEIGKINLYPVEKEVIISSNPEGAYVKNVRTNKIEGKTPVTLKKKAGSYFFHISLKEHFSESLRVNVKPADDKIEKSYNLTSMKPFKDNLTGNKWREQFAQDKLNSTLTFYSDGRMHDHSVDTKGVVHNYWGRWLIRGNNLITYLNKYPQEGRNIYTINLKNLNSRIFYGYNYLARNYTVKLIRH